MKMSHCLLGWMAVMVLCTSAWAEDAKKAAPTKAPAKAAPARRPSPSLAPIEDKPGLPRVLLIGDSISMGYTIPVRELLSGKANVHRIPTNGGPTTRGVESIDSWLGDKKWDVIHFNWGLHDIKEMPPDGKVQVSLADYEANLKKLVARLKQTDAKLIWCSTTPVAPGTPGRKPDEVPTYNAVAKKIMDANGIAIDDLYAFAEPQLTKIQIQGPPANVHYTEAGSNVLAEQVARSIEAALK
ncbi:MAG TPA: SGNH/GDSL hydrolase family protein [Pirellulales bacterium]|jgi:acyl-CoA thioesterase-1|nr:SGNH/GDSL hydrolase family protein [Pirellulales bacterium]